MLSLSKKDPQANDVRNLKSCCKQTRTSCFPITYSLELCAGHQTHKSTLHHPILLCFPPTGSGPCLSAHPADLPQWSAPALVLKLHLPLC